MEKNKKKSITIDWEDYVSVENAQISNSELQKAFNNYEEILLDISKVEDMDISAVQLIIACQKEANKRKQSFRVTGNISPSFTDYFCRIGIPIKNLTNSDELSSEVIESLAGESDA